MDEQVCNTCEETKPLTEEYWQIDNSKKNGWGKRCKDCWKLHYNARKLNIIKAVNNREVFSDFCARAASQRRLRVVERTISISIFQAINWLQNSFVYDEEMNEKHKWDCDCLQCSWVYTRTWRSHRINDGKCYADGPHCYLWEIYSSAPYGCSQGKHGYDLYHKGNLIKHGKTVKELKQFVGSKWKRK